MHKSIDTDGGKKEGRVRDGGRRERVAAMRKLGRRKTKVSKKIRHMILQYFSK